MGILWNTRRGEPIFDETPVPPLPSLTLPEQRLKVYRHLYFAVLSEKVLCCGIERNRSVRNSARKISAATC